MTFRFDYLLGETTRVIMSRTFFRVSNPCHCLGIFNFFLDTRRLPSWICSL